MYVRPLIVRKPLSILELAEKIRLENNRKEDYLKEAYYLSKQYNLTVESANVFKRKVQELLRVHNTLLQITVEAVQDEEKMFDSLSALKKKMRL
jgi:hypothetical protein